MDADERPIGWGTCSWCGDDCDEDDYNPRTRSSLCRACENREGPDDDGEAFRGNERASYERAEMVRVQRELK